MTPSNISSQITFLYFDDLDSVVPFFKEILKLELVVDQDAAKIYRIAGGAFLGIVDGAKGHCRVQEESAVLVTFVVDDVKEWYDYLKENGVNLLTDIQIPKIAPVECFFFEGPGGYHFEVQRFLEPETADEFRVLSPTFRT